MTLKRFIKILFCTLIFTSCSTVKNISYFQDVQERVGVVTSPEQDIRFRPDDKLSIVVNTKEPLLDGLLNLSVATRTIGSSTTSSGQNYVATYTVNPNGEIDFPVLGFVPVAGKTRFEVSQDIKQMLKDQELANDPVVTVEFSGLYVSVLGEVSKPGRYDIDRDKITITDALSMAGDLTIYGKRENVTVIRLEDGKQVPYHINMLDMEDLYRSPVYYLQQNDLVYVEPNEMRARQSTVNGNNIRTTSFWFSLTSLIMTITLLFL
ncbi:MAG: polysaccharide biosynthesis/export family protein [Rikenellaceae bacterium]